MCILTPHPNRVKKLIFSIKRLICLTLVSPIVFVMVTYFCFRKSQSLSSKPLVIKLIVEVKVVTNLKRLNIIEVKTSFMFYYLDKLRK